MNQYKGLSRRLERARRLARSAAPEHSEGTSGNSGAEGRRPLSWTLLETWLYEVLKMEKERIETIRVVADRIAGEILSQNDKKLLQNLWWSSRYDHLRALLIRAGVRRAERGQQPLIGFEEFVTVFEHEEDVERPDWRLARDLVLIRIIEQLHQKGWFQQHPDALPKEATQLPILDESDIRVKEELVG